MRRIHVNQVVVGEITIDPAQAHHIRDVLRLSDGGKVEVFDKSGKTGVGVLTQTSPHNLTVKVEVVQQPLNSILPWTIASAVPKGSRVDWMIEKISELGASAFIPLVTDRSIVMPAGKNKYERWERIATEAAKQSRRAGIMQIGELTSVRELVSQLASDKSAAWYLSTTPPSEPILVAGERLRSHYQTIDKDSVPTSQLVVLIGPEGGWTDAERQCFNDAGLTSVSLGETILRIETAAVAAAAIVNALFLLQPHSHANPELE